jgi:hypothetical protein
MKLMKQLIYFALTLGALTSLVHPSMPQDDDRSEHRAECLQVLTDLSVCWANSTDEEKRLIIAVAEAIVATSPPPIIVPPPGDGGGPDLPSDLLVGAQGGLADYYPLRPWSNIMHGSGPWRSSGRRLAGTSTIGDPLEPASSSIKTSGFLLPEGPYALEYTGGVVNLSGDFTVNTVGYYTLGMGAVSINSDGRASGIRLRNLSGTKFNEATVGPLRGNMDVFRLYQLGSVDNGAEISDSEVAEFFTKLAGIGVVIPVEDQGLETYLTYEYNRWEPDWASRPKATDTRWSTRRGVPYEEQFDLCRELQVKEPWIVLPLFGDQVRDTFYASELGKLCATEWTGRLIVEVGNEWWNRGFKFDDMARARASTIEAGAAIIQTETWLAFQSGFVEAGGDPTMLRWAVMGWLFDVSFLEKVVAAIPGGVLPDIIGPSFYLPSSKAHAKWKEDAQVDPTLATYTPRTILDDLERTGWDALLIGLQEHKALADQYGVEVGTYEGNLSMILGNLANAPALNKLVLAAHDDPYAGVLFSNMMQAQVDLGYSVICAFTLMHSTTTAKDGVFGLWKWTGVPRPAGTELLNW